MGHLLDHVLDHMIIGLVTTALHIMRILKFNFNLNSYIFFEKYRCIMYSWKFF